MYSLSLPDYCDEYFRKLSLLIFSFVNVLIDLDVRTDERTDVRTDGRANGRGDRLLSYGSCTACTSVGRYYLLSLGLALVTASKDDLVIAQVFKVFGTSSELSLFFQTRLPKLFML